MILIECTDLSQLNFVHISCHSPCALQAQSVLMHHDSGSEGSEKINNVTTQEQRC